MPSSEASSGPPAVRMIFEYEGDAVRLVSQQSVNVAVTGFDLAGEHRPGHYVEVRGPADETLSRVRLPEAMTACARTSRWSRAHRSSGSSCPRRRARSRWSYRRRRTRHVSLVRVVAPARRPAGPDARRTARERGTAARGTARRGTARRGTARRGTARRGTAWCRGAAGGRRAGRRRARDFPIARDDGGPRHDHR